MRTAIVRRSDTRAFTLIEVLVVVAIIAMLVAILLPSLTRARAQARSATCLSNLHQFSISIMAFVNQNKGRIPGETGPGEEGWAHAVARQFNVRTEFAYEPGKSTPSLAYIPVEKLDVFHCPERSTKTPVPFLDYVHNTLDPAGPQAHDNSWREANRKSVEVDRYQRPSDVAFICEAERDDKVEQGPEVNPPNPYPTVYWAARQWAKYRNSGEIPKYGIDVMDIRLGAHVPQGWGGINTIDPTLSLDVRRAGRGVHLGRFTDCMFLDGHAASVPMATFARAEGDTDAMHRKNFAYWLRLFGLKNPQLAATISPAIY